MLCKKHCLVVMPTTAPNVANEEMPLAQPTYEYIRAPILTEWSQPALVEYRRQRRLYEEKICERCTTTGDAAYAVAVSIKASTDPRVLDQLAFYILKKPVLEVSVEDHIRTSQTKAGNMMNDYVPDVERLFYRLKMNMHQTDIEARVAQYFIHFDKIVEKHVRVGKLEGMGAVSNKKKLREAVLVYNSLAETVLMAEPVPVNHPGKVACSVKARIG
ncbi:hypothetical protein PHMEG_0007628 [Phytophthora megakarya]|uniref:Uncharacterized protein n=1 Tax=Phytophthora megakarya TaxID=4795 RepID=A0A225WKS6_9STRA|nr:hypothetical protein PHMEG_0007628 [Phytophthora megakarya]